MSSRFPRASSRRPSALLWVLALLWAPGAASAQPTSQSVANSAGFLLQVSDPDRLLSGPPAVTLRGPKGAPRRFLLQDRGTDHDVTAGDGIYSAWVPALDDPLVKAEVRQGSQRWSGQFTIAPKTARASAFLRLEPRGALAAMSNAPVNLPNPARATPFPDTTGSGGGGSGMFSHQQKLGFGFILWALMLIYLLVGPLYLLARKRDRAAPPPLDSRPAAREQQQGGGGLMGRILPGGRQVLILPLVCAVVVSLPIFFTPGALVGPDTFRSFDWLESAKLDAFSRQALLRWLELPHWNPLLQGGMPQLSHPSDSSLSPLLLPTLLLGEAVGLKLNVVLALALGALGVALMGRDRLGLGPWYAAFAGCAYALAGWVPSRMAVGYYESSLYSIFPLLIWLFFESPGRPLRLIGATLLLALAAMHTHLGLPMLMLALALMASLELLRGRLSRGHLWRLGLVCAGGAGLAAVKLLPMWSYLQDLGWRREEHYSTFGAFYSSAADLWAQLIQVVPAVGSYDAAGVCDRGDFGYVGLGPPLAALAGLALLLYWALPRGQLVITVTGFVFLLLCFGYYAPVDLFYPLWSLPLFHSMRGAVRYFSFGLMYFGCLLAAGGLQLLARFIPGALRGPAVVSLALLCLAWPAVQSARLNLQSFTRDASPSAAPRGQFFQETLNGTWSTLHLGGRPGYDRGNMLIYQNLKAGVGTIYIPEDLPSRPRAQGKRIYDAVGRHYYPNPHYRGEAWCEGHDCSAEILEIRANLIRVRARFQQPDVLRINQNASPRWALLPGAGQWEILPAKGLLGARHGGRGVAEVTFRYRPGGAFWLGLSMSVATLAMGVCGMILLKRRRRR